VIANSVRKRAGLWPDRALALVLATRLIPLLTAPVTLYLVATRQSPAEQGFYFVLVNVQALASLVELGAGTIVVQFISHESPNLRWRADGALEGDADSVSRALSVVRQGWHWYGGLAVLLLLAIPGGAIAFGVAAERAGISLLPAWWTVVVATASYFPLVPLVCTLEGAHGLMRVQGVRLAQGVLATCALWTGLLRGGALMAVSMFAVVWLLVPAAWLASRHRALIAQVLRAMPGSPTLSNVQWRTGATWLVLWATPQLLVQIVLASTGAPEAGQLGMSLALATGPVTLAGAWLQSRYPRFAATLATQGRAALDSLVRRSTTRALIVCTIGGAGVIGLTLLLGRYAPSLRARLLPTWTVALLCATGLGWTAIQALTAYLRADREEPLLAVTTLCVVITIAITALAAPRGVLTATLAYAMSIMMIAVPLVALAFGRERSTRIDHRTEERLPTDR
jgi:hypothetical protein